MQNSMTIIDAINNAWIDAYGGDVVTDEKSLCLRVRTLAQDRKDWIFNTKTLQKAYNELEVKSNEDSTRL